MVLRIPAAASAIDTRVFVFRDQFVGDLPTIYLDG